MISPQKMRSVDNFAAKSIYSFLELQINSFTFKIFNTPYVCLPRIKLDGKVIIGLSKLIASKDVLSPDQSKLSKTISAL